jgi:hypothetical protein
MFFEDVPAPNKRCKDLSEMIKLYTLIFFLLSVAKCFVLGISFLISDVIAALILFFGADMFDSCYLSLFVFFTFIPVFEHFCSLGLLIQRRVPFQGKTILRTWFLIGSMLLYIIGWALAFQGYKEFKAAEYGLPSLDGWNNPEFTRLRNNEDEEHGRREERNANNNGGGNTEFQAFKGQGVAIG